MVAMTVYVHIVRNLHIVGDRLDIRLAPDSIEYRRLLAVICDYRDSL